MNGGGAAAAAVPPSWLADRMALFLVTSISSWRQVAILDNFEWQYLCNGSFDPII